MLSCMTKVVHSFIYSFIQLNRVASIFPRVDNLQYWTLMYTGYSNRYLFLLSTLTEFEYLRQGHRCQRRLKINLCFTWESHDTLISFSLFLFAKTFSKLNIKHSVNLKYKHDVKNYLSWSIFSRKRKIWSFHAGLFPRAAKKCTKNYNARAQPLFCSLNLLFSELPVAVVVFRKLPTSYRPRKETLEWAYNKHSRCKRAPGLYKTDNWTTKQPRNFADILGYHAQMTFHFLS